MMRIVLLSGVVLLVWAGSAVAWDAVPADSQRSSHPGVKLAQMQTPPSGGGQTQMPSQGGVMPDVGQGQSGSGGPMVASPEMMRRMEIMQRMHERHMRAHDEDEDEHQHARRRGAVIRFKRGDVEFAVSCPADESMRDCVSDAATLLDKLGSLPGQPPPSH
jgi:hypothetical protein